MHRNEEAHAKVAHLFAENLGGFETVRYTCDEVTNDRVATLASTRLCDRISVDFECLCVELWTPIVRLVKESLILLLKVPKLVSSIRLEVGVEL